MVAGEQVEIEGMAAPIDEWADIGGWFREKFAPDAFTRTIAEDEQSLLVGHRGNPIARTGSGSMTLSEDDSELTLEATVDTRDPEALSAAVKVERGDTPGLSVGFYIVSERWDDLDGDYPSRTVLEAELIEVSIVAHPAYTSTHVGLRGESSLDQDEAEAVLEQARGAAQQTPTKPTIDHEQFLKVAQARVSERTTGL